MSVRFTGRDIDRLCREIRVSREEAVRLLRHSGGDYKQAMRNYISQRNVYVEPDQVEDNERSVRAFAERLLDGGRALIERRRNAFYWTALAVIMLALVMAPRTTTCMLLVFLFLRWGTERMERRCGQTA